MTLTFYTHATGGMQDSITAALDKDLS